jgi:hypothetical protein
MKVLIAAFSAAALLASAAPASAAPAAEGIQRYEVKTEYVRKKRYKKYRSYRHYRGGSDYGSGYYQHWADKLPIGSSRWWEQMDREGRGGRRY